MKNVKRYGESGFSLLEVLIGVVVTGVATAVIAFSFQQMTTLQKQLDGRVTAAILGAGKLAELETGSQVVSFGQFDVPYSGYRWSAREVQDGTGQIPEIILVVERDGANGHTYQKEFKGYLRKE